MKEKEIIEGYELAKKVYAEEGVDVDKAMEKLDQIPLSLHCWQADDVKGFLFNEALSGGIQVNGNYPGVARNVKEVRQDLEEVLSLLPGHFKVNLHAIYADTPEKVDLDQLEPKHFASWVDWAKKEKVGLDFNPTCFSHPKAANATLSNQDEGVRQFWIEHCKRCNKIAAYFGESLGEKAMTNIWIPDGMKDQPIDRMGPRKRLLDSLDQIIAEPEANCEYNLDSVESKLFGIGLESYTVGSNEFYLGYAATRHISLTMDMGHFHPTEVVSDKISAVLLYVPHLLLHVSRPVRWDSDHVVIFDDELVEVARNLIRTGAIDRTSIALDYFDGSINRIAAYVIGVRATQLALLKAYLEPTEKLKEIELKRDYSDRLYLQEHYKEMPYAAVYDYYCWKHGKKTGKELLDQIHDYEAKVLAKRN